MPDFKDYFSNHSDVYARYRPQYPRELYAWLSSLTKEHETAWDCGTGNGQAAIDLAEFYDKVIATDPSAEQIKNAAHHPKIEYRVEKAEDTSIPSQYIDLITIANALHWFSFDDFYKEVHRVLKPGGVIAAWSYRQPSVSPEINEIINHYHSGTLGSYWRAENKLVQDEYRDVPFPFQQIDAPDFYIHKSMNLDDLIGLLNTWSATQTFITKNGYNPTEQVRNELSTLWPEGKEKTVSWKLTIKTGRLT